MKRARDWALKRLTALGLQHVRAEPFTKENAWFRGEESAQVIAPYPRELSILGLGNSVPTPAAGVEAEVVSFSSLEELTSAPAGSLAGRIALLNRRITGAQGEFGWLQSEAPSHSCCAPYPPACRDSRTPAPRAIPSEHHGFPRRRWRCRTQTCSSG
jgi:hypothetical protein